MVLCLKKNLCSEIYRAVRATPTTTDWFDSVCGCTVESEMNAVVGTESRENQGKGKPLNLPYQFGLEVKSVINEDVSSLSLCVRICDHKGEFRHLFSPLLLPIMNTHQPLWKAPKVVSNGLIREREFSHGQSKREQAKALSSLRSTQNPNREILRSPSTTLLCRTESVGSVDCLNYSTCTNKAYNDTTKRTTQISDAPIA